MQVLCTAIPLCLTSSTLVRMREKRTHLKLVRDFLTSLVLDRLEKFLLQSVNEAINLDHKVIQWLHPEKWFLSLLNKLQKESSILGMETKLWEPRDCLFHVNVLWLDFVLLCGTLCVNLFGILMPGISVNMSAMWLDFMCSNNCLHTQCPCDFSVCELTKCHVTGLH